MGSGNSTNTERKFITYVTIYNSKYRASYHNIVNRKSIRLSPSSFTESEYRRFDHYNTLDLDDNYGATITSYKGDAKEIKTHNAGTKNIPIEVRVLNGDYIQFNDKPSLIKYGRLFF